jgi:hypothetical protein
MRSVRKRYSVISASTVTLEPGGVMLAGTSGFSRTVHPADVVEVEVESTESACYANTRVAQTGASVSLSRVGADDAQVSASSCVFGRSRQSSAAERPSRNARLARELLWHRLIREIRRVHRVTRLPSVEGQRRSWGRCAQGLIGVRRSPAHLRERGRGTLHTLENFEQSQCPKRWGAAVTAAHIPRRTPLHISLYAQ